MFQSIFLHTRVQAIKKVMVLNFIQRYTSGCNEQAVTKHDIIGIFNLTIHQNGHHACKGSALLKETVKFHFTILSIFTEGRYYSVLQRKNDVSIASIHQLTKIYTFIALLIQDEVLRSVRRGIMIGFMGFGLGHELLKPPLSLPTDVH